jgi:ABC-type Fe3+/spermidine/putrescine transport system ATPase subunit
VTHDQEEALMLSNRVAVMDRGRIEQIGSPEEIYERPATRFVAEFIGRCSILEGRVDNGRFVSKAGLKLPVDTRSGDAILVIRPEYIDAAEPGGSGIVATGRIVSASYFGALTRVQVSVDGEILLLEKHFAPGARPKVDDLIQIAIDPGGIRVLPAPLR